MNRKTFLGAAIAALLGGCQTSVSQPPPFRDEVTCTQPVCQIKITVIQDEYIKVSPEILRIKGNQNVMIHWVLQTGTYEFKSDGIQFYDPKHTSQFYDSAVQGNGAQFQWKDKNSKSDDPPWAYQITVYPRQGGGKALTRDPAIFNDGG